MTTHDTTFGADVRSDDGRTFAAATERLSPGDLAVIESDHEALLAQVRSRSGSPALAAGVVLGHLSDGRLVRPQGRDLLEQATIRPANREEAEQLQAATRATMDVGTWQLGAAEATLRLRPAGFARHTFVCGQSGSGKTYALGVLLERLLLQTDLRMAVFDPNADFVHLGSTLPGVAEEDARRIAEREVKVLRSDSTRTEGAEPLRMRFRTMTRQAQAATLQLDPVHDQDEYNAFISFLTQIGPTTEMGAMLAALRSGTPGQQSLARRMENLGMLEWQVWARDLPSAADVVTGGNGVTVMDLGGFGDPAEPPALSLDMVENLWAQRQTRTPTLIVVDEAHNLCPAEPVGPVQKALVDRFIQIAGEGRKYGLWLLLSTQRPSKLHPQVLSQCDNLVLMRMNSPGDVAELADVFGFAPPSMIAAAPQFVQGEALVAGGFVPRPAFIRMGGRLTRQGGSDVSVPVG